MYKKSKLHGIWWTSSGCLKSFHSHSASGTKVTCYLNNKAKLSKSIILEEKSRKCWMSSITWWAKCLFFVQNSLRAWTIPIVQFGKQNSSSKFFLVKRWHFWTCFTLQMDMKVTEVPTIRQLELWGEMFFHMYSFNKWCLKFSIFHHKAEFNAQILEILDLEKKFGLFLVLTKDRNDY